MPVISFYNARGEIEGFLSAPQDVLDLNTPGRQWVEGRIDREIYYIDGGELTARPINPTTLADATLIDVPGNSIISINGVDYPCDEGGEVELEFDQPGTYSIVVKCWPYLDAEFEYEN